MSFIRESRFTFKSELKPYECLARLANAADDHRRLVGLIRLFGHKDVICSLDESQITLWVRNRYWNNGLQIHMTVDLFADQSGTVIEAKIGLPLSSRIALVLWVLITVLSWIGALICIIACYTGFIAIVFPLVLSLSLVWMYYMANSVAWFDTKSLTRFVMVHASAESCS